MEQEEKELLLKGLYARLPYGVYMHHKNYPDGKFKLIAVFDDGRIGVSENGIPLTPTSINECKPYLRPMSSMTEEEKEEFDKVSLIHTFWGICMDRIPKLIDWLNVHHFDYRGLIEKGLALEAPEGMYD